MPKNLFQNKFDPDAEYVARRAFGDYSIGDSIVKEDFTPRRVKQFYDARMIVMADVWSEFVGGVSPAPATTLPVIDPAPVDDGEDVIKPVVFEDGVLKLEVAQIDDEEVVSLRAELESLGVKVDKRWGIARLTEELEKATAPALALPGMTDGTA